MKRNHFCVFIILSVILGISGAVARTSQLRFAFDPETGMLKSGAPATVALVIVFVLAAILSIIGVILLKKTNPDSPKKTGLSLVVPFAFYISSLIMFGYCALLLFSIFNPQMPGIEIDATKFILAFFALYCAVSLFVIGKNRMDERDSTAYCIFGAVPVFWACFMLILTFRDKIADPIIADYVTLILSCISILFVAYSIAAHLLGKSKKHIAVFACCLGIVFILTELISSIAVNGFSLSDTDKMIEILPQLAFAILIPFAGAKIIEK